MGTFVVDMTIMLDNIIDWLVVQINTLLNVNPKAWAESMNIWDRITQTYDNVLPVASALAVLFFYIGFCENMIDVKEEMRLKTVMFLFLRISITEYFVVNALDIALDLFDITTGMAGLVKGTSQMTQFTYAPMIADEIYATETTGQIILMIFVIILYIIAPACMFLILTMLIVRLFKIMLIIPYGSIAFSAVASGGRHFENIAPGYVKYLLSILLETFSISIAINIGSALITGVNGICNMQSLWGSSAFINSLLGLLQYGFLCIMMLLLCKAAQETATRALSLDRI